MFYIGAPDGLAAIYVKPQSGAASMYYAHKDHLGSIVSLTDNAGVAVFKASYDVPIATFAIFQNVIKGIG